MKIQVSKVFADFINKTAKELGFAAQARVVKCSYRYYHMNINTLTDEWTLERYGDFDPYEDDDKQCKAIRIDYPEGFYALPKFISTEGLNKEYKRCGVKTADDLKQMIRDMVEI